MKYFVIQQIGINIKETGTQFQSVDGIAGDIQKDFLPFEGKIDIPFKLPEPFLEKKAKQTTRINVVMIPSWFQVFKNYFIDFAKEFNIGKFQTWTLKVHQNNKIIDDYVMFYSENPVKSEIINFERSVFNLGKFSDWNFIGEKLEIPDSEELNIYNKKFNETDNLIKPQSLFLDFSKIKLDFFRISDIPLISGHYFISQKMKDKIEENKFTGFSFQEIEEMDKRIKITY